MNGFNQFAEDIRCPVVTVASFTNWTFGFIGGGFNSKQGVIIAQRDRKDGG